jgi:hypothetical protein
MNRIFGGPSQIACHPAMSDNGMYVTCGFFAYAPLSGYGSNLWLLDSGSIYSRAITGTNVPSDFDYLFYDQKSMQKVTSKAAITGPGMFWYDTTNKKLYTWIAGGGSPVDYKAFGGMWKLFSDELVMVSTKNKLIDYGSPDNVIIRLAHVWSNFRDNAWDEVPTALSWNNKYVLFYSNWNGSGRHDVFIVKTTAPKSTKAGGTYNP